MKIDALFDEEQAILDPIEERPELKKIREEFIANLPKVNIFLIHTDLSIKKECS